METEVVINKFQKRVDSFSDVCRMRISFEGNAAEAGSELEGNCLKVLKKASSEILRLNG